MGDNYICIRKTYYLNKLWEVGDKLPAGTPPNRHFAIDGIIKEVNMAAPETPGDDPRTTKEIRKDLEKLLKKPFRADASRKELFWAWMAAADAAKDESERPAPGTGDLADYTDGPEVANPVLEKLFSEMTPEDIDAVTAKQIGAKLRKKPYFLEIPERGVTKAELVKRGIAVEDAIKRNAQEAG